jgi:hypothetical protein
MVKLCKHIKQDGVSCHSPALHGEGYCCHHLRYKGYPLRTWRIPYPEPWRLRLAPLDSLSSIHVSLDRVDRAEAAGHLAARTAGLMRYGLQLAASNLRFMQDSRLAGRNGGAPNRSNADPIRLSRLRV